MSENIVLCIDGTGNGPGGAEATKVWEVFAAAAEIPARQVRCYLPGVGVKDAASVCRYGPDWKCLARLRPPDDALPAWLARFGPGGRALALGAGLGTEERIIQAYACLCHHYAPGDRNLSLRLQPWCERSALAGGFHGYGGRVVPRQAGVRGPGLRLVCASAGVGAPRAAGFGASGHRCVAAGQRHLSGAASRRAGGTPVDPGAALPDVSSFSWCVGYGGLAGGIGPDGLAKAAPGRSEEAFRILDSVARSFPEGLKIASSLQYILLKLLSGVAGDSSSVKI